jgi:class 3 adenylate cyclase/CheY-like chemotaxis protein/HD superfamily phosphodiesterase
VRNRKGIKEILSGGGNNILQSDSITDAIDILKRKEIGILLINIDNPDFGGIELLQMLKEVSNVKNMYKIVITDNTSSGAKMVKGLTEGAVDFISVPFNPNLIRAKIDVYKSLYFKDQRINQLLSNIFPITVLEDLSNNGKFSPKRVENGVILFTDFVDFSIKAKNIKPIRLLKKLEYYFTRFDEIMARYKIEKVKTIGDAYMALAGVTENSPEPEIRACLAALEIRDFMRTERNIARATNRDYWEVRIGLHCGPLVAGILGTSKISFDVWGDSVNIAARAEQGSKPGHISVTNAVLEKVQDLFITEARGEVAIHKRGGSMPMHYLLNIHPDHTLPDDENIASSALRVRCGLPSIDFELMRKDITNRLRSLLPEDLVYHDLNHTLNVEKAAMRFARLEGIDEDSILLLRTAVLYHDTGFIWRYEENEQFAVKLAQANLPRFGFTEKQIDVVVSIIASTQNGNKPKNILEKIMCDADHDYLGRADYYNVAEKLRTEMANFGKSMEEKEWIEFQLKYLENTHRYHTETAKNIRVQGKKSRIAELQTELAMLTP